MLRLASIAPLIAAAILGAQAPQRPPVAPPFYALRPGVSRIGPLDSAALADTLDDFLARDMDELQVPGAVVAVVQDGRVLVLKGYGVADSASRTPVDAERTVFRLGSVTKPITATAVMQLVEAGRLDLHADVNRYLTAFTVPPAFGRPVTAHDLLTHTAGFDVRLNGTAAPNEAGVRPLAAYLATDLPPRVRPPGAVYAYSNHGYALLGHLVEAISGERYDEYVTRHVLRPLGMTGASLRFTPEVARVAATGYEPRGRGHRLAPPTHPNIVPAAGLNATGRDMTRFMIAMLEGGAADGARVLAESTVATMQAPHFRQDPRVPGMAYGLMESFWRGQRLLLHAGGIRGYMCALYLWPDQHLGLFVADNGYRGDLVSDVAFKLMDVAFPYPRRLPPLLAGDAARVAKYAGAYRIANQAVRNLEKAGGLRNPPLAIAAPGDGTLRVFGDTFVMVAPRLFRNAGSETLAFVEDARGRPTGVVTTYPFQGNDVFLRIPFLVTDVPSQLLFSVAALLSLFTLVRPPRPPLPSSPMVRAAPPSRASRRATRAARLSAACTVAYMVLMYLGLRAAGPAGLLYGVPWPMDAAGIVAIAAALAALALAPVAVWAWRTPSWALGARLHLTLLAACSLAFAAALWYWRLLGVQH